MVAVNIGTLSILSGMALRWQTWYFHGKISIWSCCTGRLGVSLLIIPFKMTSQMDLMFPYKFDIYPGIFQQCVKIHILEMSDFIVIDC